MGHAQLNAIYRDAKIEENKGRIEKSEETLVEHKQTLVEHDLLKVRRGRFTLKTGESLGLPECAVIDEAKLNALPDDAFAALRRAGALTLIYCQLMSMNSWSNLVHRASI